MSRFYLNLHNSVGFVVDTEGQELPSEAAAREEAIRNIRSIVSAEVHDGTVDLRGRIEITSEDGEVLAVVPFAEAVCIREAG